MFKMVPVKIGSHEEDIEAGVIVVEIPLALSKFKIKEWGVTIDFEENVLHLRITNKDVKLEEAATGHLEISLAKKYKE